MVGQPVQRCPCIDDGGKQSCGGFAGGKAGNEVAAVSVFLVT
ncbi:hypothetical protein X743_31090 [Mesorhizobium sp. LNHC252B00]|nr:hypothetical protein X743_31090 [Mesorhizobium sp. LNHC252B00]